MHSLTFIVYLMLIDFITFI